MPSKQLLRPKLREQGMAQCSVVNEANIDKQMFRYFSILKRSECWIVNAADPHFRLMFFPNIIFCRYDYDYDYGNLLLNSPAPFCLWYGINWQIFFLRTFKLLFREIGIFIRGIARTNKIEDGKKSCLFRGYFSLIKYVIKRSSQQQPPILNIFRIEIKRKQESFFVIPSEAQTVSVASCAESA